MGHGRRRKQAHDDRHDWIGIRRGLCTLCRKTFTFLPWFSPPYGHYSWIARSQALQGYFQEQGTLESAAPLVKDPDRLPAPSTLRRWFRALDSPELCQRLEPVPFDGQSPQPAGPLGVIRRQSSFPFLEKALEVVRRRLAVGDILRQGWLILSWQTSALFLQILLPLRF